MCVCVCARYLHCLFSKLFEGAFERFTSLHAVPQSLLHSCYIFKLCIPKRPYVHGQISALGVDLTCGPAMASRKMRFRAPAPALEEAAHPTCLMPVSVRNEENVTGFDFTMQPGNVRETWKCHQVNKVLVEESGSPIIVLAGHRQGYRML